MFQGAYLDPILGVCCAFLLKCLDLRVRVLERWGGANLDLCAVCALCDYLWGFTRSTTVVPPRNGSGGVYAPVTATAVTARYAVLELGLTFGNNARGPLLVCNIYDFKVVPRL